MDGFWKKERRADNEDEGEASFVQEVRCNCKRCTYASLLLPPGVHCSTLRSAALPSTGQHGTARHGSSPDDEPLAVCVLRDGERTGVQGGEERGRHFEAPQGVTCR